MIDEITLIAKLLKIEALHAGATSAGERAAAASARERIMERLAATARTEKPHEFRLSLHDPWARRVFLALARRYGIEPYRYYRQRRTTVMVKVAPSFFEGTLWPEFEAITAELRGFLDDITQRVIAEAIHKDSSDAAEQNEPLPE